MQIVFCEKHLHLSTWPPAILQEAGGGEAQSLDIQDDGSLGCTRAARNQRDIRSGDRDRGWGKRRSNKQQAPTGEGTRRRAEGKISRRRTGLLIRGSV